MDPFLHLKRWHAAMHARPAVERAYAIGKRINAAPTVHDEQSRRILFEQDGNSLR